ncbi:MAG: alpha/beta hydrolase, partial [Pyramidobacter sp.]|nr:alpha/beta hydrolase [Pyramidobacter sp.]
MTMMKTVLLGALAVAFCCGAAFAAGELKAQDACKAQGGTAKLNPEKLTLTQEWDKVFPKSDKVDHRKVTFVNRFGITLAADLYTPNGMTGRLPALAVAGPFGAVKEQCSGLYAQIMAERGFVAVAFDPSFTGESGGNVRFVASPDINTEDFSA